MQQDGILGDIADHAAPFAQVQIGKRDSVDQDLSPDRFEKACDQVNQGCFAGSGGADDTR